MIAALMYAANMDIFYDDFALDSYYLSHRKRRKISLSKNISCDKFLNNTFDKYHLKLWWRSQIPPFISHTRTPDGWVKYKRFIKFN